MSTADPTPVRRRLWHRPLLALATLALSVSARAQDARWDASVELGVSRLSAVEETTAGAGVRLSYRLVDWLAADAGVLLAPGDLGEPAFSASQAEFLGGLRAGPRPNPVAGYAALRAGTVSYAEAPEPLACIAIFPPPLECVLAEGTTRPALQLAAGAELLAGDAMLRFEVGGRMVSLPGPSFDHQRDVHDDDYWSQELRVSISAGLRF